MHFAKTISEEYHEECSMPDIMHGMIPGQSAVPRSYRVFNPKRSFTYTSCGANVSTDEGLWVSYLLLHWYDGEIRVIVSKLTTLPGGYHAIVGSAQQDYLLQLQEVLPV